MRNLTIAFATALTLLSFGCKKKSEGGDSAAAMAKMSEFKDAMCKCSDAPCAQKVSDDMTKWSQEQSKNTTAAKMSEADTKKAAEISEELGKCMQKAMTPPAAPADPAAAPADPNAPAAPADPAAAPAPGAAPAGGAAPAAPAAPAGETKPEAKK